MNCPACKKRSLKPAKLEHGLPGYSCANCQGFLLDVLAYRSWLESLPQDTTEKRMSLEAAEDSTAAMMCPKCSKIMTKYRISGQIENKLDLCSSCGELWIDGGEWKLLKQLDLASKIPQILSEPWQRSVREESLEKSVESKYESLFGKSDYTKIRQFGDWVSGHEKSAQIQDYLNRLLRSR